MPAGGWQILQYATRNTYAIRNANISSNSSTTTTLQGKPGENSHLVPGFASDPRRQRQWRVTIRRNCIVVYLPMAGIRATNWFQLNRFGISFNRSPGTPPTESPVGLFVDDGELWLASGNGVFNVLPLSWTRKLASVIGRIMLRN